MQRLVASQHDENVVYALFDNTKNGDFKPYLFKSTNRGATWTSIAGDLPEHGPVLVVRRGPRQSEPAVRRHRVRPVLHRRRRQEVDPPARHLPTIAVRDLAIQKRENDLVLATFGRGFYVLDDYSPLRQTTAQVLPEGRPRLHRQGGRDRGAGDRQGARIAGRTALDGGEPARRRGDHLLDSRHAANAAAAAAGCRARGRAEEGGASYPSQAEITAEEDEEAPQTFLTITDAGGKVVRRLSVPGARGIHRFAWNLRGVAGDAAGGPVVVAVAVAGGFGGAGRTAASFVRAGHLSRSLSRDAPAASRRARRRADDHRLRRSGVTCRRPQRTAATEYQDNVLKLQRSFTGALEQANNMKTRTTAIRRAIADSPPTSSCWTTRSRSIGASRRCSACLRGDETLRGLESGSPSTIQSRVNSAAAGARGLTGAPTGTQQTNYTIAFDELNAESRS